MNNELRPPFYKRVLALIIDIIILVIIGFISALFLEDLYVSTGKYGTLIGTAIVIIYFSLLQSRIAKGQSLGKMIIDAKVTDLNGEYLSLDKSFLRSCILFFPILNMNTFTGEKTFFLGALFFSVIIAIIYFVLINKSRRGLHDIFSKTVVINKSVNNIELNNKDDLSKKKIIPISILAILIIGFSLYNSLTYKPDDKYESTINKIEQIDGVINVISLSPSTTTTYVPGEPSEKITAFNVSVMINDEDEATNTDSYYFDKIFDITKQEIPAVDTVDHVRIFLNYGYNIGIARKSLMVSKEY